jgi:hypothetical protein
MVIWSGVVRADGSDLPSLRVSRQHVRRQHVVRIGGHASRSHTLRSMPLLVLPRAAATRGQVLLTDQGGIALFYAGICAQFRLCLHSVRRRARSTSPTETLWPPGYALVVVFFAPRVLPLHAAASAPLLFVVVPLGVDVRTARFVVSASRALSLPGIDAVRLPLIVLALGVERLAVVSAPRARPLLHVDAVQLVGVVSAPCAAVLRGSTTPPRALFRPAATLQWRFLAVFSYPRSNLNSQTPTPSDLSPPTVQAKWMRRARTLGHRCR